MSSGHAALEDQSLEGAAKRYRRVLLEIWRKIADEKREWSGAVFKDGSYSLREGDISSAEVDNGSDLIWHSHPDGILALSLEDWLCFFCCGASLTALFTKGGILLIRKRDLHAGLNRKLLDTAAAFRGYPSIVFYTMVSALSDFFKVDAEAVPAGKRPDIFKVEHLVMIPPCLGSP